METVSQAKPPSSRSSEPSARSRGQARWLLLGLLALAAAVRIYWGAQPRIIWGDEPFYLWFGQSLLSGQGYQFYGNSGVHLSPLYPLLAGLISKIIAVFAGNSPQTLAAGSVTLYVICGTLLLLPIYGIARRTTGRESIGLCAGLMTALYPTLTARVPLWGTMTEPIYLLLVATAWWALLVAQQERRLWGYALAGASLGLAYLTRNEAIVYLVAGLAVMALIELVIPGPKARPGESVGQVANPSYTPGSRWAGVKRALLGAVLAVGIFAILISPYLIALHVQTGKWQILEEAGSTYVSAQGLAFKSMPAFDQATWGLDAASGEVYFFSPTSEGQGLLAAITADPRKFLRLLRVNLADLMVTTFSIQLVPLLFAGLALLGLFARRWDTRRLRGELLLITSLVGPLSFLPFFIQPRYIAGVLIPALVWIGGGTVWLGEWLAQTWAQLRAERRSGAGAAAGVTLSPFLCALPALLLAVVLLWQTPRIWNQQAGLSGFRQVHRTAAEALLAAGATPDSLVLSRFPAIAFHAGIRWAPTPVASWPEVAAYAQRKKADFIAVDAREAELRPQLAFLMDPAQAPPELGYVTTVDDGTGPVVIYRFR